MFWIVQVEMGESVAEAGERMLKNIQGKVRQ